MEGQGIVDDQRRSHAMAHGGRQGQHAARGALPAAPRSAGALSGRNISISVEGAGDRPFDVLRGQEAGMRWRVRLPSACSSARLVCRRFGRPNMHAEQLLEGLAERGRLPVEAIRAAEANRAESVPIFLRTIEQYETPGVDSASPDALFLIFHMLGSWREKAAYRPLARLLRRPLDVVDAILGDTVTETSQRVMAAVF